MTISLGFDLGGSTLRAAAFVDDDPAPRAEFRELLSTKRDSDFLVDRIDHISRDLIVRAGGNSEEQVPIGVGVAAMLGDRRGTVVNSPHLGWRNVAFGEKLAEKLGPHRAVGVYNDANAITWGEFTAGAGQGVSDFIAVYVGTGIGAGIVSAGQLVDGASHCAGELGHIKVAWGDNAALCACGQRGCVEAYVGGLRIATRIHEALGGRRPPSTSAVEFAGGKTAEVTPEHVDKVAAAGDPWALELWSELAPMLAVALGNAVAILNPQRLILGGGLLSRTPLLREQALVALLLAAPVAATAQLDIVDAILGDYAGQVGAAHLARSGHTMSAHR